MNISIFFKVEMIGTLIRKIKKAITPSDLVMKSIELLKKFLAFSLSDKLSILMFFEVDSFL
ncbi:hypothetical protein EB1_04180 [Empedobacter brevis NBRC 14943 = ATCC 43319]|uniref:Uncharacterized protein n=1 Tax=Empedobacter brevis NBRC 14943 = ATCC 43319 TaxID=1218108 RepID=A0A511NDQ8_9FLAO|nr:hypothetical protein EB1_04180 [Empedobacter brevis NBRC 14943 = ATCC 43319]